MIEINAKKLFSGTYIAADIAIQRLIDDGTVDIRGLVEGMRHERPFAVGMPCHYAFVHRSVIEYALNHQLLNFDFNVEELDDTQEYDKKYRLVVRDYIKNARSIYMKDD